MYKILMCSHKSTWPLELAQQDVSWIWNTLHWIFSSTECHSWMIVLLLHIQEASHSIIRLKSSYYERFYVVFPSLFCQSQWKRMFVLSIICHLNLIISHAYFTVQLIWGDILPAKYATLLLVEAMIHYLIR